MNYISMRTSSYHKYVVSVYYLYVEFDLSSSSSSISMTIYTYTHTHRWVWGKQVIRQAAPVVAKKKSPSSSQSIQIIGSKHCLPPMPLEMGFGILFRLDYDNDDNYNASSRSRHAKDWKDRDYSNDLETMSLLTDNLDRYDLSLEDLNLNSLDLNENDDDDYDDVNGNGNANGHNGRDFDGNEKAIECMEAGDDKVEQTVDNEVEEIVMAIVDDNDDEEDGEDDDAGGGIEDGEAVVAYDGQDRDTGNNGNDIDDEQYVDNNNNDDRGIDDEESRNNDDREMKSLGKAQKNRATEKSSRGSGSSDKKDSGTKKVKGQQGREREKESIIKDDDDIVGSSGGGVVGGSNKRGTKYVNKKKARRYANQDEDDRELAMLGLGHTSSKTGQKLSDIQNDIMEEKQRKDLKQKQHKVGVKLVEKEGWNELKLLLDVSIASKFDELILTDALKASDLSSQEIRALSKFPVHQGIDIVKLFCEAKDLGRVGNKSAFLAGIIRRYSMDARKGSKAQLVGKRNQDKPASSSSSVVATSVVEVTEDVTSIIHVDESSIHDNNDNDNDNDDGKESNLTDEVEQFTGSPSPEDILMYALPVCCPYACLKNYKYKVKLTPGVGKKGKSCKQAIEVFSRFKDCLVREKELITGLTDTEVVATMIGDVKLSMPGLYSNQGQQQQGKKKGKVMK